MIDRLLDKLVFRPLAHFWKKREAREERARDFARRHYPGLERRLQHLTIELRNDALRSDATPRFDEQVVVVLHKLGRLYAWEEARLRDEEGSELFSFVSRSDRKLAATLYALGKEDLGLISGRLLKGKISTTAHEKLADLAERDTSWDDFREEVATDEQLVGLRDCVADAIRAGGHRWSIVNFRVLERFLSEAREAGELRPDDRQYVEALMRTADIRIDDASLDTWDRPLRIKVYNDWDERIEFAPDETQIRVCAADERRCRPECGVAELPIVDVASGERKKRLEPGEVAVADWDRNAGDGAPVADGRYQIVYLPDSCDDSAMTTSAYGVDYELFRSTGAQSWSTRHGSL